MFIFDWRRFSLRSLGLQELVVCSEELSAPSLSGPIDLLVSDGS